jgi:hypothetical protein
MSLKDKLKKIAKQEMEAEVDWSQVREKWIERVDALFKQIEEWFKDLTEDGLRISYPEIEIHEEVLGKYAIHSMELGLGKENSIVFEPIARVIVGGKGRIDFYKLGARSKRMMLLQFDEDDGAKWEIWPSKISKDRQEFSKENLERIIEDWISYE